MFAIVNIDHVNTYFVLPPGTHGNIGEIELSKYVTIDDLIPRDFDPILGGDKLPKSLYIMR